MNKNFKKSASLFQSQEKYMLMKENLRNREQYEEL